MNSRRNFLKIGSLAAAGSIVFGSRNIFSKTAGNETYFSIPTGIRSNLCYSTNCETFKPLINTIFLIKSEALSTNERKKAPNSSLRLVEVVEHRFSKRRLNKISGEGFSLIFQAEDKKALEDKIYQISHPQTGEFPLFISTVGRSGKRYQAVFCHVRA